MKAQNTNSMCRLETKVKIISNQQLLIPMVFHLPSLGYKEQMSEITFRKKVFF